MLSETSTYRIFLIGTIVANYCIYSPILTYFLQKFYKLKRTLLYEKRYGKLVCASNIVALLLLLITRPLQMLRSVIPMSSFMYNNGIFILNSYLYTLFIYLMTWRFYLLFFRLNWKKSSLNSQWKQHLNSQSNRSPAAATKLDFFLQNKTTYKHKSGIWFIIIYFMHTTLICIAHSYTRDTIIEIAMSLPPFIVVVLLWKATPQFYDYFFIRNEMKWLCITYAIDILCSFAVYVAKTDSLYQIVIANVRSFTLLMMVLTTTFYVWYKNETEIISDSDAGESGVNLSNFDFNSQASEQHTIVRILSTLRCRKQNANKERDRTQVIDLIGNIDSFEIFMQHLCNEYSMENLLAIVEFTQFKLQLLMDVNFMKNISDFQQDNEKCIDDFIETIKSKKFNLFASKQESDKDEDVENLLDLSPSIFKETLIKYGMGNDDTSADNDDDKQCIIEIEGDDDGDILDIYNTLKSSLNICHRKYFKNTYNSCFIARDAVSYMIDTNISGDCEKAVEIGQRLVDKKLIKHVRKAHPFGNEYLLFEFIENDNDNNSDDKNTVVKTLELEVADKLFDLVDISDRKWHLRKYKECFIAKEAIQVMINAELAIDENDAIKLGNRLIKTKIIEHVERKHKTFEDAYLYYRFIHKHDGVVDNGYDDSTHTHSSLVSDIIEDSKTITHQQLRRNAAKLKRNFDIKNRKWHLKTYSNCFVGSEAIPIVIDLGMAETEKAAITLCNQLIALKIIEHVEHDHSFINGNFYYRFVNDDYAQSAISLSPPAMSWSVDSVEMDELQGKGRKLRENLEIRDRKWHLNKYKKCFVGKQCVEMMIKLQYAATIKEALQIGNRLIDANIIRHVTNDHRFENKYYFYSFVSDLAHLEDEQNEAKEEINGDNSKPKHFLTLGYNKYTKYMYDKYNILELPASLPRSVIVFGNEGNDELQYQLNHHFALKHNHKHYMSEGDNNYDNIPKINELLTRQQRELVVANKKSDYVEIIKKLYEKYILSSSELQVNVSYNVRGRLIFLMQEENELSCNDIFELFDQSITELLRLLSDSVSRFKTTKEFHKVGKVASPHNLFRAIPLHKINSVSPATSDWSIQ